MPRQVEAVRVALQPVAQRDAGDGQRAAPRHVDQTRQRIDLVFVETGHVLGDHRADEHTTERRPAGGEVPVVDGHPARRHVPARVPDVQLGEQHGGLRLLAVRSHR
jgi:hypothetical protein